MKTCKSMKMLLICLLASVGLSTGVQAQDYDKEEAIKFIRKASQDWASVAVTGDPTPMKTLFADDFRGIDSKGRFYTKQDFISYIESGPTKLDYNNVNQDVLTIRFYGNIAIVQAYEDWAVNGEELRFYWTDIYEYRTDHWEIISAQDMTSDRSDPNSGALFEIE